MKMKKVTLDESILDISSWLTEKDIENLIPYCFDGIELIPIKVKLKNKNNLRKYLSIVREVDIFYKQNNKIPTMFSLNVTKENYQKLLNNEDLEVVVNE